MGGEKQDLGDGHSLSWIVDTEGERIGAQIDHPSKASQSPCSGYIQFKVSAFHRDNPDKMSEAEKNRPIWQFNGDFAKPTFSPSLQCLCGDHGFITEGKWIRA